MENLNTLSILATDVTKLKLLAEERLKKLYGLEKIWFYIEEMTKVTILTDCSRLQGQWVANDFHEPTRKATVLYVTGHTGYTGSLIFSVSFT